MPFVIWVDVPGLPWCSYLGLSSMESFELGYLRNILSNRLLQHTLTLLDEETEQQQQKSSLVPLRVNILISPG